MKKFKAIAATTDICLNEYQRSLTLEDLEKFVGHLDIVTLDYREDTCVGEVTKAYIEDNALVVEGWVYQEEIMDMSGMSCAISYKGTLEEVHTPMFYAFTTSPADTGTTPIEEIE